MLIKVRLVIILLVVVILSGCIQKTLIFTGESENWKVQYEVKEVNNRCGEFGGESSGYIKYIGGNSIPKRLEYSIDNTEGSTTLDEYGVLTLPYACSNASEGSEIEAIIEWGAKSETIPLPLK